MENLRIDELAKRLLEGLPESVRTIRHDIESNFRAVLQSSLGRLDLATRTEFDVQATLLERAQARIEQLERRLTLLEQAQGLANAGEHHSPSD